MQHPGSPQGRMGAYPGPGGQPGAGPNMGPRGYSTPAMQYQGSERPLPPPPPGAPGNEMVRAGGGSAKTSTQLGQYCVFTFMEDVYSDYSLLLLTDLLRYDAPLSGPKISRMLNQLQFKLQVEEQYRKGIEKMAQLYRDEGDRRLKNETESKKRESENKIQLLKRALKRYETLRQFETGEEDEGEFGIVGNGSDHKLIKLLHITEFLPDGQRKENLRKPLAGKLIISLKMARDLNHVPLSRRSSKVFNETTVVIKIEGNERGVSHPSRNDKWYEEFDLVIDKANEIELTIYDTQNGGDPTPIGMLWLRVSEVIEALRRQKVEADTQGAGWVPAATAVRAATIRGPSGGPSSNADSSLHREATKVGGNGPLSKTVQGIDGWFAVEPAGAVALHLDFG